MKEEDRELLERMREVPDYIALKESLDEAGLCYDELDLAKII